MMSNYEELFYQSQAALADAIDALEKVTAHLKECMINSEETVISDTNSQEN